MEPLHDRLARRVRPADREVQLLGRGPELAGGQQVRRREVFGRSIWRFLRTYIFQLGVLDGMHGLVFCMLQAYGTYLKWALLWGWHVNAARGRMPNLPIFDDNESHLARRSKRESKDLEDLRTPRTSP